MWFSLTSEEASCLRNICVLSRFPDYTRDGTCIGLQVLQMLVASQTSSTERFYLRMLLQTGAQIWHKTMEFPQKQKCRFCPVSCCPCKTVVRIPGEFARNRWKHKNGSLFSTSQWSSVTLGLLACLFLNKNGNKPNRHWVRSLSLQVVYMTGFAPQNNEQFMFLFLIFQLTLGLFFLDGWSLLVHRLASPRSFQLDFSVHRILFIVTAVAQVSLSSVWGGQSPEGTDSNSVRMCQEHVSTSFDQCPMRALSCMGPSQPDFWCTTLFNKHFFCQIGCLLELFLASQLATSLWYISEQPRHQILEEVSHGSNSPGWPPGFLRFYIWE